MTLESQSAETWKWEIVIISIYPCHQESFFITRFVYDLKFLSDLLLK